MPFFILLLGKPKENRSQSMIPGLTGTSPRIKLPPQRSIDIPLELDEPTDVLTNSTSLIISPEEANILSQKFLPARHVGNEWHLMFSTESHGFSLSTIYRYVKRGFFKSQFFGDWFSTF